MVLFKYKIKINIMSLIIKKFIEEAKLGPIEQQKELLHVLSIYPFPEKKHKLFKKLNKSEKYGLIYDHIISEFAKRLSEGEKVFNSKDLRKKITYTIKKIRFYIKEMRSKKPTIIYSFSKEYKLLFCYIYTRLEKSHNDDSYIENNIYEIIHNINYICFKINYSIHLRTKIKTFDMYTGEQEDISPQQNPLYSVKHNYDMYPEHNIYNDQIDFIDPYHPLKNESEQKEKEIKKEIKIILNFKRNLEF
jgi:hypothetical protein